METVHDTPFGGFRTTITKSSNFHPSTQLWARITKPFVVTFFLFKLNNHQTTKSSNHQIKCTHTFLLCNKNQHISTSINHHLLGQLVILCLNRNQIHPFSISNRRQFPRIVPILYPEWLRMNYFPLHIINQQFAGFAF